MTDELKREIYNKYQSYLSENYNERYIYRLILQEGYDQQNVDEVMEFINAEKKQIAEEKNKYRSFISILLYFAGAVVICAGLALMIVGGIKMGMILIALAVIIWINANR